MRHISSLFAFLLSPTLSFCGDVFWDDLCIILPVREIYRTNWMALRFLPSKKGKYRESRLSSEPRVNEKHTEEEGVASYISYKC